MIYGERIRQVRELLGETQTTFGEEVGLRQSAVSTAEGRVGELPEKVITAIATHSGFPPAYFERPPSMGVEEYQFRARLRVKQADRHRAVRCAEIVHESFTLMRQMASTVDVQVPDLSAEGPRQAAAIMRSVMAQEPLAPIPNLLLPIERIGVVVLALPVVARKHDAFCWWNTMTLEPYPIVAVLSGSPGDRLRWSVAHEMGHLVLHRAGGSSVDIEREADQFAAELLTPLEALDREMPNAPKLTSLYAMKKRWGVAVQSLIRRARELDRIDDHQYTSLFKQIGARGERMNEQFQIKREKPRAYRKMAEVIYGDAPASGLADLAGWTPEFAEDVLSGFAGRWELPTKRRSLPAPSGVAPVVPIRRRS